MASSRSNYIVAAVCGIAGTIALSIYFSAPFWLIPLAPPNASAEHIMQFGRGYRTVILWDTWLQQIGSLLSVIFALALVHLANRWNSFAGRLVLVASTVILVLSLAEGTFILAAIQAGDNGHDASAVTCVDLANVFIHIFLLAPSLFLVLGYSLLKSPLLPSAFPVIALVLGILFQVLGVAGLFSNTALMIVIFILLAQNLWTICASVALIVRSRSSYLLEGTAG